ncbi:hypothetical protein [Rhizobium sp. C4]|uniref:hypothetical protein n=1 Tax=Rhizobium sp. C4 TaxID=1349800 RepID=UPI001E3F3DCC|nr:hypothetical protein [Rhizobium sp. C4]MCD2171913.1 hypothetical protein [Rhizobium sp. C4]
METIKDDQSTIWVPGSPTLTKTTNIPPVAVTLPAVYGVSGSGKARWIMALPANIMLILIIVSGAPNWPSLLTSENLGPIGGVLLILGFIFLLSGIVVSAYSLLWNMHCAKNYPSSVLTISRQGILDLRVSDGIIEWGDVLRAGVSHANRGGTSVALYMRPGFEGVLKGPQALRRIIIPRAKATLITIEITSLSGDRNALVEVILLLAKQANQPLKVA